MSEEDKGYTSILLPSAGVALFTKDSESKEAFLALANDWRFARVTLTVEEGDVETAIAAYDGKPSPDLVIVQTENIDESFSGRLETLGSTCSEGTAAIVIGPVNDVNLYRKLVGMGVSDYLVKPIKTPQLGDDIAATLIDKIGVTGSRLIAVMGVKGGTGATVLSEALAWGVSDIMGHKTFLMDAAGGWSTLSVGMDFEPTTTLAEAVRAAVENNEDSLTRMMFSASDKLTVLSSGGDVLLEDLVDPDGFETLLEMLMVTYPVIIVDLSGAPAGLKKTTLTRAHEIFLITTPTLPAVRAARTLRQEIKELRGGSDEGLDIIVNMVGLSSKAEVPKAQIEQGLEVKAGAFIPYDPKLFISTESEAQKLTESAGGKEVVFKILPLLRKVLASMGSDISEEGAEEDKKSGLGQFLDKLKAKS